MQTRAASALYDYWNEQRGNRPLPLRGEIEPAGLAAVLPDLFILEYDGTADPRFRLAGTRLCAQFARELKGSRFDALFAPDERNRIARIAVNVMAHRAPALLLVDMLDGGRETTGVEIVLLPLATRGRLADRVIGAFAPLPGMRPPLSAFRHGTLASVSTIDTARAGNRRPTAAPSSSVVTVAMSRVLHLRVFEGGRTRENASET